MCIHYIYKEKRKKEVSKKKGKTNEQFSDRVRPFDWLVRSVKEKQDGITEEERAS